MELGLELRALVSAGFGLGTALLVYGFVLSRARAAATRRMMTFVVGEVQIESSGPLRSLDVRQLGSALVALIRRRSGLVRVLLILLALSAIALGFTTGSFLWLLTALLFAGSLFFVSGKSKRERLLEEQAPAALEMLAAGLRAGYSVPQALALVARESPLPTAEEFGILEREIGLGLDLATAATRMAQRTANQDYEFVAIILTVQHDTGGNLAQILDAVATTLRERYELRLLVAALTAQQRLSMIVLTCLPLAVLTFLTIANRSFVDPLYNEPIGRMMLGLVGILLTLGWSVMRSMGRIEV